MKKKENIFLGHNLKAKEYGENKRMLQLYKDGDVTDFVFDKEGNLKNIFSEFSKEEVKEQLNKIVDEFYKKY